MEIKLTDYQKALVEQTLLQKQSAEKAQEELMSMIFAANGKALPKPPVAISYNNGIVSWEESPVELTPTIEG